jgi:2,4-dienoyl-CoA reductase (NADPH2)
VEEHEIQAIIAGYAKVAGHCAEGGFDGIELQCSHSSIVRGFLSPTTNRRTDRYGGSLENRMRIMLEIVTAVRAAIGRGLALGVRICGDELIEGGIKIEDAVEVATAVQASGLVDYINTSIGVATSTLFMIEASMHIPPGYALFIPSTIRKAVDLPVVAVGRFKDPLQAEQAIEEGHCDLVGVVRGQVADPEFVAKTRAGAAEEIRLCLSCNQECVGRVGFNRWLGCAENPRSGREAQPAPNRTAKSRRIVVVGAGPAGLQAAITAASRGHSVTVYEKEAVAGGQLRLAATVPNRAEIGDIIRNQLAECKRLGIAIHYDTNVDADFIRSLHTNAVVVATGAEAAMPAWAPSEPSADGPRIVDVREVIDGSVEPAGRVLVIDEVGFHQATSVAELLADRGCQVEVVTSAMMVGQDLGGTLDMEMWCTRASAKGIVQSPEFSALNMDGPRLVVLHWPTGRTEQKEADWIVLAIPAKPNDRLYWDLKQSGIETHRVGDSVAPRRIHTAVVDGYRVGAAI